jgi:phosphohistidine phosphatase
MRLETIYIVRHGIAEDYSAAGSDAERRLTEVGIEKTRRAALGLERIGVTPELILTSPLRRAEETARIIAEVLGGAPVRQTATLAPGGRFDEIVAEMTKAPKPAQVMVVGHQPDLGMLASLLAAGDAESAYLPFRKAGAACFEIAGSPASLHGTLQWFLTPAQLRAIASSKQSR